MGDFEAGLGRVRRRGLRNRVVLVVRCLVVLPLVLLLAYAVLGIDSNALMFGLCRG